MRSLDDLDAAVAFVKKQSEGEKRTTAVRELLDGKVDVGPAIVVKPGVSTRDGRLDRDGAHLLHRRALFVTELRAKSVWPK